MVKTNAAYREAARLLREGGILGAEREADLLVAHLTGAHRLQTLELDDETHQRLLALVQRRLSRQPMQYLLGEWDFLDLTLEVGPGVLIPRPETEELCLAAAKLLEGCKAPAVLDLCAGSGALALGLQSLLPGAAVTAVELYPEAFGYLERNIRRFAACHPAAPTAVLADVRDYADELPAQSLDLIVANPPYVSEAEYAALAPELAFEPKTALVAEEDGLFFYRLITRRYFSKLKPGGWFAFEIGSGQGPATEALLREAGCQNVQVARDMQGLPRMATARRPAQPQNPA